MLRLETEIVTGSDGQFDGVVYSGCRLAELPPAMDMEAATALMEAACLPADQRKIEFGLAELSLLCKSRPEDTDDVAARMALFAAKLHAYPADVALEAMRRWGDHEKWFPSWAELRAKCDMLGGKRMAVRDALRRANAQPG